MDSRIDTLIENWQKRNITGSYCLNKEQSVEKILEIISKGASVGISGSVTLDTLGIVKRLEARGNKVYNQYQEGLSRGESLELRRQGTQADYYLASANAISQQGELVFFSAYGNRTAGISYAKNVIIVAGKNKIVFDLEAAIARAREYVTPLNCKRLGWNTPCVRDGGSCQDDLCIMPDYKRMCCQVLIIEGEVAADRMKVILVNEDLGY
jgi:hypothetical protein